jgi:hypothetical protein
MKKYELILQGDKKLIVDDIQAKKILAAVNNKTEIIEIENTRFRFSMFKGLFPYKEEVADNSEIWKKENLEWNETCEHMAKRPLEEKVTIEITNRVIPGLEINKIKMTDSQLAVMENNIREFFTNNPQYPRCPMRIWWPFIKEVIAPVDPKTKKRAKPSIDPSKWWNYVLRNDSAIEEWLKYHNYANR